MPTANLPIIPPTLPEGFCPTSWQNFVNEAVGKAIVQFTSSSFSVLIVQSTAPGATDRDKPWLNTTDDRIYRWVGGAWVSRHPSTPGGIERRLVRGTTAQIETYDGGEAGVVGDAAGPMWEEDTDFAARFPVGVGTTAGGTVIALGGTGGEDAHVLLQAELPSTTHRHLSPWMASTGASDATTFPYGNGPAITGSGKVVDDSGNNHSDRVLPYTESVGLGSDTAHNNLPPYIGVRWIKRTARIYYRGS